MSQDSLFDSPPDRGAANLDALRRFHAGQKIGQREQNVLLAHGLLFDPHVDGKLRLTPPGRAKVLAL